jgi:murein DD-endopeptidase MepM/ murein hydrolase activator NlpD
MKKTVIPIIALLAFAVLFASGKNGFSGASIMRSPTIKASPISVESSKIVAPAVSIKTSNQADLAKQVKQSIENQIVLPTIAVLPKMILPGDPILITINATSTLSAIYFDNKKVSIFEFDGKPHALVGIDFNEKATLHTVKVSFANGSTTGQLVRVTSRPVVERPLGIPDKLGGNTAKAESELLTNLAKENSILNNVPTATTTLWSKTFVDPLASLFVTDDYGYDRKTVNSTIVHKGTDFRAPVGTEVKAMNDGVVKVAREFVVYGNTVIVDHGLGLQTMYMHLSKIGVKVGDRVVAGQAIAQSGMTGYAEQPHLHVSVKIKGVSIDPVVFMGLFK